MKTKKAKTIDEWQIPTYVKDGQLKGQDEKKPALLRLVVSLGSKLVDYLLSRVPFSKLDNHMTKRLGKPWSKSVQVRKEVLAYNDGFHTGEAKGRKDGARQARETILKQLKEEK